MEKKKLIRSVGIVGGFTLISRVLGLGRDILMAAFFGTSVSMSAFVVAFTIPNLFRRLFGEGALSASFVPVFVEARHKGGDASAWAMARRVITLVGTVLLGITIVGIIIITLTLHFGTFDRQVTLTLELLRVMFPYMIFICLAALSMAMLNSFKHFAVPAATPCLLNIIWIAAVIMICPRMGSDPVVQIRAVAWAIVIAGVVQMFVQLPPLMFRGYRPGFSFDWKDERVTRMLTLMGPAAVGMAVTQFNVLIDRLLAAWIGGWAPAALFFSERLIYLPLGIFATALGTVLLPTFSSQAAQGKGEEMKATLSHSLRNLLFVMTPAAVGLLVLAHPIIRMIFERGEFTAESTDLTAIALQFYAPGLIVFGLAKVFVPAFYAQQDMRTPVRIGIWAMTLNLVLNVAFVLSWPLYMKHAGLALATVAAEAFYAIVLAILLQRRIGSLDWKKISASMSRHLAAAGVMAWAVLFVLPILGQQLTVLPLSPQVLQITATLASIAVGIMTYLAAGTVFGSPELEDFKQTLARKKK